MKITGKQLADAAVKPLLYLGASITGVCITLKILLTISEKRNG